MTADDGDQAAGAAASARDAGVAADAARRVRAARVVSADEVAGEAAGSGGVGAPTEPRAAEAAPSGGDAPAYPRPRTRRWPDLGPPKVWLIDFRLASGPVPPQRSGVASGPGSPAT